MKKIALALAAVLSLSIAVPAYAGIGVIIDGKPVNFTASTGSPIIDENGRTLVPLRATMESYGCNVKWYEEEKGASVSIGDDMVVAVIGVNKIATTDEIIPIDTSPQIIDGRVYLPIRAILEHFGAVVGWNNDTQSVTVTRPANFISHLDWQRNMIMAEIERQEAEKRAAQEKAEREAREQEEQRRKELEEWHEEQMAKVDKIREDALEYDKQMQKEAEQARQEAIKKQQEAIYDSVIGSGGYGNSYAASQGYYNPGMYGGYGSTYAGAAYQQYLDNLLVQSKYK
ncbi:stalk domain-containing protein [Anaerotignum sp.]